MLIIALLALRNQNLQFYAVPKSLEVENRPGGRERKQTEEAPRKPSRTAPAAPGAGKAYLIKNVRSERDGTVSLNGIAWAAEGKPCSERALTKQRPIESP